MKERIIDISDSGASLSVKHEQLVIRSQDVEATVPLEEIAALLVSNPAVNYTQAVLTGLCERGGAFILCDQKRMPIGMIMPTTGNHVQSERFALQASANRPTRKRLWQQIVISKIKAQALLLEKVTGRDHGLRRLADQVRSGDTGNMEAQAARRYWPALFGVRFRRHRTGQGPNSRLNYGYAILRSMVTRAVAGAGLHPSLGLHHHNRYDSFCLANDLMEPYRPLVDAAVVKISRQLGEEPSLGRESKAILVAALTDCRYQAGNEDRYFFDILTGMASSLAQVFEGKRKKLVLPILINATEST